LRSSASKDPAQKAAQLRTRICVLRMTATAVCRHPAQRSHEHSMTAYQHFANKTVHTSMSVNAQVLVRMPSLNTVTRMGLTLGSCLVPALLDKVHSSTHGKSGCVQSLSVPCRQQNTAHKVLLHASSARDRRQRHHTMQAPPQIIKPPQAQHASSLQLAAAWSEKPSTNRPRSSHSRTTAPSRCHTAVHMHHQQRPLLSAAHGYGFRSVLARSTVSL
jgi:hypothetical protein